MSVWNALMNAANNTITVLNIRTYSMVACPLFPHSALIALAFQLRIPAPALLILFVLFGNSGSFRGNKPFFNCFYDRFCTAADAQFMKRAV